MAMSLRGNGLLSRLKALLAIQRFNHTLVESGLQAQLYADIGSDSKLERGKFDTSRWKKLDSRTLGITGSMISPSSYIVLKVLQGAGFEAYLVGGCVRDLLLNKVPKDFDVITTAALKQVRKEFHCAEIVGRRFPICRVHIKGSVVEVSSFETVAEQDKDKEEFPLPQMPKGCDKKDFVLWTNSLQRDFSVNSLFFDPFVNKIYDYANGIMDLKSLKLRTLIPAQLSFQEDCARILRGLRIAARIGLSFSKETENAIYKLSSSIASLAKSRLMLELNYMLSYGAAEASLCLLWRFHLLEILLPFHGAHLARQRCKGTSPNSMMLMRLFSNLDKIVTCDQPSHCTLWAAILAFHLALINNPQDPLVVWTFASVLYYANWKVGVKFAREQAEAPISFVPEILEAYNLMPDDELVEKVAQLARIVQESVHALTETNCLLEKMASFPDLPCSGLVFVPRTTGKYIVELFRVLVLNPASPLKKRRKSFAINYYLLGKGDLREMRCVLGKIIIDTMSSKVGQMKNILEEERTLPDIFHPRERAKSLEHKCIEAPSDPDMHHNGFKEDKKRCMFPSDTEMSKKVKKKPKSIARQCDPFEEQISENLSMVVKEKHTIADDREGMKKHQKLIKKGHDSTYTEIDNNALEEERCCRSEEVKQQETASEHKKDRLHRQKGFKKEDERHRQEGTKEKSSKRTLYDLFR